jgi:hypothetical protein
MDRYELTMVVDYNSAYAFSEHDELDDAIQTAEKSFRRCYITDTDTMEIVWESEEEEGVR